MTGTFDRATVIEAAQKKVDRLMQLRHEEDERTIERYQKRWFFKDRTREEARDKAARNWDYPTVRYGLQLALAENILSMAQATEDKHYSLSPKEASSIDLI